MYDRKLIEAYMCGGKRTEIIDSWGDMSCPWSIFGWTQIYHNRQKEALQAMKAKNWWMVTNLKAIR